MPEKKQGMRVVLDMTVGLKGHNITCDNFFTSHGLRSCWKESSPWWGLWGRTSLNFPLHWCWPGGERHSHPNLLSLTQHLVSYLPKKNKNVILMSTLHKDSAVSEAEHRKPQIILDYNRNKGGVDCLDKVIYIFICQAFDLLVFMWNIAFCVRHVQYCFQSIHYCFFHCSLLVHTPASKRQLVGLCRCSTTSTSTRDVDFFIMPTILWSSFSSLPQGRTSR